jgi:hypothetical protein
MAGRVRDFCRTHPDPANPGYTKAVQRLNTMLDHYEKALNQQHAGRAAHVGARAQLEAITADVMLIIRQVDALNRFRFRANAESLAAWKSARDVAWPLPPEKVGGSQKPAA